MFWIIVVLSLMLIQSAAILITEYCRPHKAVAWLVILYTFPLIGFVLYFFVAREYSCIRQTRREENSRWEWEQIREALAERCGSRLPDRWPNQTGWQDDRVHALLKNVSPLPITAGNETTVYEDGEQCFEAMLEAMAAAEHHIHIEFYIIRDDQLGTRFQRLLIRKAQEGVSVRFIYDGIGSRRLGKSFLKQLQDAGVETGCFFPPLATFMDKRINYRNHRKILVVDGKIGFFGGLNIGDEYLGKNPEIGYWRDTHFRIEGDAVLWIQYTFLTDWHMVTGQLLKDAAYYQIQECQGNEVVQIVKSGPDETILELIFSCVVSAKKRIYIETPYFIPDSSILLALKTAVMSGVDVIVIIPCVPDSKLVYYASLSYVQELLRLGIRFFRYNNGFIHAKVIIADDIACSGTANMDMRSFSGQFEINAVFFDRKVVDRLLQDFYRDLGLSEEILLSEFQNRPRLEKSLETFARLLSPLF